MNCNLYTLAQRRESVPHPVRAPETWGDMSCRDKSSGGIQGRSTSIGLSRGPMQSGWIPQLGPFIACATGCVSLAAFHYNYRLG